MITIKYEIYRNDYDRETNLSRVFPNLDSFGKWLINYATPYSGDYEHLTAWVGDTFWNKFHETCCIKSRNYAEDKDIWVYLVQNDDGVIFSNGKYTNGKHHISKHMIEFLRNLQNKYRNPEFTFVE